MKIAFLLALLSNIIFFLWGFNSRSVEVPISISEEGEEKQILLFSELLEKDKCYQVGSFSNENYLIDWVKSNKITPSFVTPSRIESGWYAEILVEKGIFISAMKMPEKLFLSTCKAVL